ncbi:hypothetical protein POTOM_027796 [Populus tomentosa]|uniref:Uncharacterized protein n=1 Tax=Populus tomentosa TaxID=118781 RepID=A0A8X7Z7R7_POPTO|nr:hypothetical protein POTOM_027796 [Populus tomentosa]
MIGREWKVGGYFLIEFSVSAFCDATGNRTLGLKLSFSLKATCIPVSFSQFCETCVSDRLSCEVYNLHDFSENAVTKEHFLGLIDWVEARRPEPAVAKIYCGGGEDEGPAFAVSSGQRFPVSKVDFGWGLPPFGSYHFPWGGTAGYVMHMPKPAGNGDWMVYMHARAERTAGVHRDRSFQFPEALDLQLSTLPNCIIKLAR